LETYFTACKIIVVNISKVSNIIFFAKKKKADVHHDLLLFLSNARSWPDFWLILPEWKTRLSQFVIFSWSARHSMSTALQLLICLLKTCCLKVLNEISAKTGACVLHTGVRTSTDSIKKNRLVIHRSIQVPVSVVNLLHFSNLTDLISF
jgi:hypothetical protein